MLPEHEHLIPDAAECDGRAEDDVPEIAPARFVLKEEGEALLEKHMKQSSNKERYAMLLQQFRACAHKF
jgi:hypothetical protein